MPVHVLEGKGGGGLEEEEIKPFRVVCATDQPLVEQLRLNGFTHKENIAFIASEIRVGLCGWVGGWVDG